MWEPDSDGKWGPSYQDIEQFFSYGYYGDYGYHLNMNYDEQPLDRSYYEDNQYSNVNREMFFNSLQNGLSELSIADGSASSNAVHPVQEHLQLPPNAIQQHQQLLYPMEGHLQVPPNAIQEHLQVSYPVEENLQVSSNAVQEHLQASQFQTYTPNQNWYYGPSSLNYYYAAGNEREEKKQMGPSRPCSTPENQSSDGEENSNTLEIKDEPKLDGEVGKRLNEITPVAHTPKINGDIPSTDEASTDHQRLQDRLELYGLVESKVEGDGNCQFRALSDQLYRTLEHHKSVRRRVVRQLKLHRKLYEGYVPMPFTEYLRQIAKNGEWGDHVTLQAAADSYGVKIFVITSFKDTIFIEILPKLFKSKRVVFLSYWAEVHYNSIYPVEELPPSGYEKEEEKKNKITELPPSVEEKKNKITELPPSGYEKQEEKKNENKKKKKKWWNFMSRHQA